VWTPSACGRSKGGPDRRKPGRSRQGRVQAAFGWRAWRAAAVGRPERGQRQRLDHVRGGAGRHPTDPHAQRPPAPPANQGPRRQGLRSSPLPPLPTSAWHPPPDRPPHDRVLPTAGPPPLDHRTHRGLARWMAAAADRYERSSERFYALAMLACAVICFNALPQPHGEPIRNARGARLTVRSSTLLRPSCLLIHHRRTGRAPAGRCGGPAWRSPPYRAAS
jgi:hypothetical protein